MKKSWLSFLFLIFATLLKAQAIKQQMWFDLYNNVKISERCQYNAELGFRFLLNEEKWSRYNIRNIFIYEINKTFSISSAINFHNLDQNFAAKDFEIRPWQGITVSLPLSNSICLGNQFRYEERFLFYRNEHLRYNGRFRYEISTSLPIRRMKSCQEFIYIPLTEEIIINMDGPGLRYPLYNRLSVGLGYHLYKQVRVELVYAKQHMKHTNEGDFIGADNLYRFKLRFDWD